SRISVCLTKVISPGKGTGVFCATDAWMCRRTVVVPQSKASIRRRRTCTRALTAFTIVELMVVIAVITILISILVPSFRAVREAARAMRCENNLREISNAFLLFATDHDRRLPGGY